MIHISSYYALTKLKVKLHKIQNQPIKECMQNSSSAEWREKARAHALMFENGKRIVTLKSQIPEMQLFI